MNWNIASSFQRDSIRQHRVEIKRDCNEVLSMVQREYNIPVHIYKIAVWWLLNLSGIKALYSLVCFDTLFTYLLTYLL